MIFTPTSGNMRDSHHDLVEALNSVKVDPSEAYTSCLNRMEEGKRFFFIGNGGSAAIASHMAADWMKNGMLRTMSFNDPAALTCISNDLGYEAVFTLPLQSHARKSDVLIAISSSGESQSILRAVELARAVGLYVVTLSGFAPDNALRGRGDVNFYVPSGKYGTVEITHLAILHAMLDEFIG